jgi:hypothetical protein
MEGSKMKYEYFRQSGRWEDIAREVCSWANTNINLARLVAITSVFCGYDKTNMVNLYYNEAVIPPDVLAQTSHLVLAYQVLANPRTMLHSWRNHNSLILPQLDELTQRGEIVAVNSLEGKDAKDNVTIVWYKRPK